ncbi:sigma 54-interacting transcriptional regulator [Thiocystis violacea]|uniref:sigma 54-interacting transcriptional regulator n=1 Tax=Thiocystis violacea TaxID=13725 RepID=UPI0019047D17|nr:sigma 54-interacting transcriptional regulator [Thiocystis violacea]MBK1718435.1 sigma-54-dependent Fis family transcriptional regulator [Thiocystis violacea]
MNLKIEMIGNSPAFARLLNAARMVAATDASLLLLGESGSGKATLAREIHAASPGRADPFLTFACSGAPPGGFASFLDESASRQSRLYLSEVAELNADDQARLLHLLVQRDQGARSAPHRLIAASAQDLEAAIRQGRFRRDLYQRLCVVPLEVPPLRERVLDIPLLTEHFILQAAARLQRDPPRLTAGAERLLRRYHWPGNLRELANLCERLVILLPGASVGPENLPREILHGQPAGEAPSGFDLPPHGLDLNSLEAELIRQALALAGGNKSRAARLLGLSRDTLLYRLRKHLIPG